MGQAFLFILREIVLPDSCLRRTLLCRLFSLHCPRIARLIAGMARLQAGQRNSGGNLPNRVHRCLFARLSLLVLLLLISASVTIEAQIADRYAIYSSLILTSPVVRSGSGNVPTEDDIYLIEETTATSRSGFGPRGVTSLEPAGSCIKVPAADQTDFGEILADYDLRKNNAVTLAKQFTLSRPYLLLSTDEVEKFLRDAMNATPQYRPPNLPPPVNPNPLYTQSKRVFRLGDVYFNKDRTAAIVYFSVYTATADYNGGWRAFRKTAGGGWEANRSWATCGAGASR